LTARMHEIKNSGKEDLCTLLQIFYFGDYITTRGDAKPWLDSAADYCGFTNSRRDSVVLGLVATILASRLSLAIASQSNPGAVACS